MPDTVTVGIDLGTTFSMVSHTDQYGIPALFPDAEAVKELQTPSVVCIRASGALVGRPAEDHLLSHPEEPVARFSKLLLGSEETALVDSLGREWGADAISGLVLRKICYDVEAATRKKVGRSVITVPAQFNHLQRSETVNAATLYAGIEQVDIIDEPVAAATYYGYSQSEGEETLLVFDLGGGTFDATVMQSSPDGLFVLGTDGIRNLGGKNFDESISDVIHAFYLREDRDGLSKEHIRSTFAKTSEQIKLAFCQGQDEKVSKSLMVGGKPLRFLMTSQQFHSMTEGLISQTLECCERCLQGVGFSWADVDRILLTGGGSLNPQILKKIHDRSKLPENRISTRQPHQAVAYGASLIAGADEKQLGFKLMQQITNYEIGFRVWSYQEGEYSFHPLVAKNEPLPISVTQIFYTTRPDQDRMVFELVQRKSSEDDVTSIGHFIFGPIRSPKKNYPIEVVLTCLTNGLIELEAVDRETGEKVSRVVDRDGELKSSRVVKDMQTIQLMKVNDF